MLNEPNTLCTGLTRYERGRVDEMDSIAEHLRRMARDAGYRKVDAGELLAYASKLSHEAGLVVADGHGSMRRGYAYFKDGKLVGNDVVADCLTRDEARMPCVDRMCVCDVLDGIAADIVRALNELQGEQFYLYAEDLLEVSRHLLDIAEMRLLAPGEEDGDE